MNLQELTHDLTYAWLTGIFDILWSFPYRFVLKKADQFDLPVNTISEKAMSDNISSSTSALFIGESIWVNIGLAIYEFNTWILIVYFTPAMILVGLLNNCLTLAVFLSRRARTIGLSESLRLYYVALAALDLFTILTSHLLDFNCLLHWKSFCC